MQNEWTREIERLTDLVKKSEEEMLFWRHDSTGAISNSNKINEVIEKVNLIIDILNELIDAKEQATDTISDSFGSTWSAYCPECGKKTMQVVRPGKVQCANCGS